MKKLFSILVFNLVLFTFVQAQTQPVEMPSGYRFQYRIKGPEYKHSQVLELSVDEYGNYLVATFRGEKASFVYLYIYNLYTWDEKYKIKLDDNRCELYNSMFDESGDFFYVNVDVFRNKFKKINLKTKEITEVDCSETPKGCRKLEQQLYRVDAYTIGDNYFIFRDDKFENYIKIFVKKEMYIPKTSEEEAQANYGLKNAMYVDPSKGGIIMLTPAELREMKAGNEIEKNGVNLFYDPNAIDEKGNVKPYTPGEYEAFKIRLTDNEMNKLNKKISFVYDHFVVKLDLDALEEEMKQNGQ